MSIRPLCPELAEKARLELNEDPKMIQSDLQHIKDWIAKQPHLKARTDDQWLLAFLRGSKFSLERAKEKIELYYTCRTTAADLFRIKHTDPLFNEILNLGTFLILPYSGKPGFPLVTIIRPGTYDADKYALTDIVAVSNLIQKIILMEDDNAVISGSHTILDLDNVTMGHFLQMTPTVMKKMVVTSQDAMPFRMKGTHYLNTPTGFETIFNAMKALLNEKNRNRLFVHNKNVEGMYKHIPKDLLPTEYGGNAGSIEDLIDYWKKKVEEYSAWLKEDEQFGTDETKRVGKPRTSEDMFGVEGSFRKLEVD